VGVDGNGVCQTNGGPAMVADNNKHECDGEYFPVLFLVTVGLIAFSFFPFRLRRKVHWVSDS
jgi:hypothetical protein